jgi:hypothetical protein
MMAKLMVALEAFEVTFFVVTFAALMGKVKTAFMPKMVMALGTMVVMAVPIRQSHTINPLIHLLIYNIHKLLQMLYVNLIACGSRPGTAFRSLSPGGGKRTP